MKMKTHRQKLTAWTFNPTTAEDLKEILADMQDSELAYYACLRDSVIGRICWSELGNRMGHAKLTIQTVETEGRLTGLTFEAFAEPIHEDVLVKAS
jgi:hypothetical protein